MPPKAGTTFGFEIDFVALRLTLWLSWLMYRYLSLSGIEGANLVIDPASGSFPLLEMIDFQSICSTNQWKGVVFWEPFPPSLSLDGSVGICYESWAVGELCPS